MDFTQTSTTRMNRRISMQALDDPLTVSDTGEPIKTYTQYAEVWASVRTLSGRERNASQQVQATLSHEITVRYSSSTSVVKSSDRIVYGGRYFDIKDPRNIDEANIEIRMLCVEALG